MSLRNLSLGLASTLLVLTACKKEDIPPKTYEVPAIIQPYIDAFEQEAAARGVELSIDNLIVEFESDLQGGDAAGLCTFASQNNPTPHVRLDTTSFNWRNNLYHREILVFHELGHCILNRLHRDDLLPNGNIASMMRSTGEQIYGGSLNAFKRDYYLDELFDPSTPAPDWATSFPAYGSIPAAQKEDVFIEHFANNFNNWTVGNSANSSSQVANGRLFFQSKNATTAYFIARAVDLDPTRNFEMELSMRVASGSNSIMYQWGGDASGAGFNFFGFSPDSAAFLGNWNTGLAIGRPAEGLVPDTYTKVTIRRIGTDYHLYLNETYFDLLQFEPLQGNRIGFYVGPETAMEIDYLFIRYLP